jgi:hypothetical protein
VTIGDNIYIKNMNSEAERQDISEVNDINLNPEGTEADNEFLKKFGVVQDAIKNVISAHKRNWEEAVTKNPGGVITNAEYSSGQEVFKKYQQFLRSIEEGLEQETITKEEASNMIGKFIRAITNTTLNYPDKKNLGVMYMEVIELLKSICKLLSIPEPEWFSKIRRLEKGEKPDFLDMNGFIFGSEKIEKIAYFRYNGGYR